MHSFSDESTHVGAVISGMHIPHLSNEDKARHEFANRLADR
jgi:hypothetical protein